MRARHLLAPAIAFLLAGIFSGLAAPDARAEYRCHAEGISDRYDALFKIAARRWMPKALDGQSACLLKAQCFVESRLDPDAVSPAHAVGLCQVLESTAGDYGLRGKLRDAKNNVKAGALTFSRMWSLWVTPRSSLCRWRLATASYNAGGGNIIAAQRLSGGRLCWEDISPFLHKVTGEKHSAETIAYVTRIQDVLLRLRGLSLVGQGRHIGPTFAVHDHGDHGTGYPEPHSQIALENLAGGVEVSDLPHRALVDLRGRARHTVPQNHVTRVVQSVPRYQVPGIDAGANIAGMAGEFALFELPPKLLFQHQARQFLRPAVDIHEGISAAVPTAGCDQAPILQPLCSRDFGAENPIKRPAAARRWPARERISVFPPAQVMGVAPAPFFGRVPATVDLAYLGGSHGDSPVIAVVRGGIGGPSRSVPPIIPDHGGPLQ